MKDVRDTPLACMVGVVLALTGATPASGPPPWRVGLHGYGPVRYGMTLAEASRVLGEQLRPGEEIAGDGCSQIRPRALPAGASFMVIDGRIERVDVDSAGTLTVSGAHVGSTEDEVRALYPGRIRTDPHPYLEPVGHYLVYVPSDTLRPRFGLIFETDGRRVTSFRAGRHPAVAYSEGCA